MPTTNVFFQELIAISPRSWKLGDDPENNPTLLELAPQLAEIVPEADASIQLGKTHRAGIGPAAPGSRQDDNHRFQNLHALSQIIVRYRYYCSYHLHLHQFR